MGGGIRHGCAATLGGDSGMLPKNMQMLVPIQQLLSL